MSSTLGSDSPITSQGVGRTYPMSTSGKVHDIGSSVKKVNHESGSWTLRLRTKTHVPLE